MRSNIRPVAKPIILTVDDDPAVSQAITRDLRSRYGDRYRLARATSGAEALSSLEEFARRDQSVALIVSDHRMPEMTGIELLGHSKVPAPGAKLVLLTAYADTDVAIKAINDIGLDHYLMKPWAPPEERLFPDPRRSARRLGDREHPPVRRRSSRGQSLVGAQLRHEDVPRPQPRAIPVARARARCRSARGCKPCSVATTHELPLVVLADGTVLHGAGPRDLAERSRAAHERGVEPLRPRGDRRRSGRAGRRRLRRVRRASNRGDRTRRARRASIAERTHRELPRLSQRPQRRRPVASRRRRRPAGSAPRWCWRAMSRRSSRAAACTPCGSTTAREIEARAVVVATGVTYRLLEAPGLAEFTGRGVFYGAASSDAPATEGDDVYICGAANSAGQAALNLARFARRVTLLVRGDAMEKSMSQYLVERVYNTENIEVRLKTEIGCGGGEDHLEWLVLLDRATGEQERVSDELAVRVHRRHSAHGLARRFDRQGRQGLHPHRARHRVGRWRHAALDAQRPPFLLETSRPGVFAVGDVRLSSMKRVASAVGEGSSAVSLVHLYLETV